MALSIFRRAPTSLPSPKFGGGAGGESPASLIQVLRARDGARLRRYQELLDFYEGAHFPAGATRGRTRLVVNYARAVVDKGVAYLLGRGIRFSVPPLPPTPSPHRGGGGKGTLGDTPRPLAEGAEPPLHSPRSLAPTGSESEGEGMAREAEALLGLIAEENELNLVLLQAAPTPQCWAMPCSRFPGTRPAERGAPTRSGRRRDGCGW